MIEIGEPAPHQSRVLVQVFMRDDGYMSGNPQWVRIIQPIAIKSMAQEVSDALVGTVVRCLFNHDDFEHFFPGLLPEGSLAAFTEDVMEALANAGNGDAAHAFFVANPDPITEFAFDAERPLREEWFQISKEYGANSEKAEQIWKKITKLQRNTSFPRSLIILPFGTYTEVSAP